MNIKTTAKILESVIFHRKKDEVDPLEDRKIKHKNYIIRSF